MLTSVVHVVHNSTQAHRGAGSRFWRPVASSIPAPRKVLPPPCPAGCGGFLIANPRLTILASPTKQTIAANPNRERIAFHKPDFLPNSQPSIRSLAQLQPSKISLITHHSSLLTCFSNRNSRLLEIDLNPAETILTYFLTATKPHIAAFSSVYYCAADGPPMRGVSSQEAVRHPSKLVRIREEMAVSPQALGAQSTTAQDFI